MEDQKMPNLNNINSAMNNIFDVLQGENGEQNVLASILGMPDDQFRKMAPVMLSDIEKSFNDPNTKLIIAQAFNANGLKAEDATDTFFEITQQLQDINEGISEEKKNFISIVLGMISQAINESENIVKRKMAIPIEIGENAKMPSYATLGSAALDLYSPAEYIIKPGETVLIPVNIKVALPKSYAFLIHPRSGLSLKSKLRICNSIGLIDSDYKDTIGVIIENTEPKIKDFTLTDDGRVQGIVYGQSYTIGAGERFAQMRLVEVPKAVFYEVSSVADMGDDRGGGFGHTGKE